MVRCSLSCGLVLACLARVAQAGDVLRVGAGQPFATIQAAVDAAAVGDLILVEAGIYPAFAVDGKSVAIVGTGGGAFDVRTAPGVPAIAVQGIPAGGSVSILGARVSYAEPSTPAVHVVANAGAVRFSRLVVSLDADLPNAAARAAVEVEATDTFWLVDSQISSTTARLGNTLDPTGSNDGLSALEMLDSDGVVQNTSLRGYDNPGEYGGDGLRARGDISIWLRSDVVNANPDARFVGANGGAFGGHAVHQIASPARRDRIKMCPGVPLDPGLGALENGGKYGINDDPGVMVFPCWLGGVCTTYRSPDVCAGQALGENTLLSDTVAPGGLVTVRVWTVFARSYATAMSATTHYRRNWPGFYGHPLLRTASYGLVAAGVTSGGGVPSITNIAVPNQAGLAGLQLTFQTAFGPVGGPFDALSAPALCVIAP